MNENDKWAGFFADPIEWPEMTAEDLRQQAREARINTPNNILENWE